LHSGPAEKVVSSLPSRFRTLTRNQRSGHVVPASVLVNSIGPIESIFREMWRGIAVRIDDSRRLKLLQLHRSSAQHKHRGFPDSRNPASGLGVAASSYSFLPQLIWAASFSEMERMLFHRVEGVSTFEERPAQVYVFNHEGLQEHAEKNKLCVARVVMAKDSG